MFFCLCKIIACQQLIITDELTNSAAYSAHYNYFCYDKRKHRKTCNLYVAIAAQPSLHESFYEWRDVGKLKFIRLDVKMQNANISSDYLAEELRNKIYEEVASVPQLAVGVGIVTLLLNSCAFFAMTLQKTVRKQKKFVLVRLLCFNYILYGLGILIYGSSVLYRRYVTEVPFISQRDCFLENLVFDFALHLLTDVSLFTAVDCCMAVMVPKFYMQVYKPKLLNIIIILILIHTAMLEVLGYAFTTMQKQSFCAYVSRTNHTYLVIEQIHVNILLIITVFVYIFLMIFVRRKIRLLKHQGVNVSQARKEMNLKLLITLFMSISAYTVTIIVGCIVVSFALQLNDAVESMLMTRYALIAYFAGIFHFILLCFRTSEFRKLMLNVYLRRHFTIKTLSISTHTNRVTVINGTNQPMQAT
ncbi:hypothetical protein T4A_2813 [Trichinella pseudospiralis]|uniref:G-protein coupled receptors family 1 profile domain-containing protein n=2 Tax=Trichinella pseudospiralis TaxID=6337 RepID=A0A0V1E043_TRIPS|nr:hypothetical protein T4A_2813 [Trichinella pseudospiralis]